MENKTSRSDIFGRYIVTGIISLGAILMSLDFIFEYFELDFSRWLNSPLGIGIVMFANLIIFTVSFSRMPSLRCHLLYIFQRLEQAHESKSLN